MKRLLLTFTIFAALAHVVRAQQIAIKTDAVADACFVPNLNAELVTGNKTSVNMTMQYAFHSFGTNIRSFSVMPEFRYWFGGRPLTREFIGLSVMGGTYQNPSDDDRIDKKSFRGNVGGAGLTFGYVWDLGKSNRWVMELHAGLGVYFYHQKSRYKAEYVDGVYTGAPFRESGISILPYKLGFSFAYIIPVEKKKKKDKEED